MGSGNEEGRWVYGTDGPAYHGRAEADFAQTGLQTGKKVGQVNDIRRDKPVIAFNWKMPSDSAARKRRPIVTGFLDYFPSAVAAVAFLSWAGNEKHNKGEALHWARGKSMDTEDCIGRHLVERGGVDFIETDDAIYEIPHEVALAWRAMANLQLACESHGADKAKGAK